MSNTSSTGQSWNIQQSIDHLSKNAQPKSIGKCARYVRQAIEAGGMDTNGRPGSAYQYKGYLPSKGFNAIGNITGKEEQRKWSEQNAQVGDISVMDHGQHGHICMWNGSKWISDFAQNNMWPYKGDGTCTIFRYGGHVDGSLEPYNGEIGSGNSSENASESFNTAGALGINPNSIIWRKYKDSVRGQGNGIEYIVNPSEGSIDVKISESDLGGGKIEGTLLIAPRNYQGDNVVFSSLASITRNILKEILETNGILFDERNKTKHNVSDLFVYDEMQMYKLGPNWSVHTVKKPILNIDETNKLVKQMVLSSPGNIVYKNKNFYDNNLSISEGIVVNMHIENNLFEGSIDSSADDTSSNTNQGTGCGNGECTPIDYNNVVPTASGIQLCANAKWTKPRNGEPKYLVIHYTAGGNSRPGAAKNTCNMWMNSDRAASADYVVDDANIFQYNPDPAHIACYAVGKPKQGVPYNMHNCISIEVCSSFDKQKGKSINNANDAGWYFTNETIGNAIKLAKIIMQKFNIPLSNVIRHYDVSGKLCPGIIGWNPDSGSESEWINFKQMLA